MTPRNPQQGVAFIWIHVRLFVPLHVHDFCCITTLPAYDGRMGTRTLCRKIY